MASTGSGDEACDGAVHIDAQADFLLRAVIDRCGPFRIPVGRVEGRLLEHETDDRTVDATFLQMVLGDLQRLVDGERRHIVGGKSRDARNGERHDQGEEAE